jgi:hypothetical protein
VNGVVVERTKDRVVIETGPGRVSLPMSRVERIVESRSALAAFQERAAELDPGDAAGWAALARWAAERDLFTAAREAWRRVLAVDPAHPEANAALGRVDVDGTWMEEDEAYRARGYVRFDGRWVTPEEHEVLVREQAAEEEAARERREAELRVREAEARAREAEARAREAEAAGEAEGGGIPYWWVLAGGGGVLLPPPVDPVDAPPPPPPPASPPVVTNPPSAHHPSLAPSSHPTSSATSLPLGSVHTPERPER